MHGCEQQQLFLPAYELFFFINSSFCGFCDGFVSRQFIPFILSLSSLNMDMAKVIFAIVMIKVGGETKQEMHVLGELWKNKQNKHPKWNFNGFYSLNYVAAISLLHMVRLSL